MDRSGLNYKYDCLLGNKLKVCDGYKLELSSHSEL